MITAKLILDKNEIIISSSEARKLASSLCYCAEEADDHGRMATSIVNKNKAKSFLNIVVCGVKKE